MYCLWKWRLAALLPKHGVSWLGVGRVIKKAKFAPLLNYELVLGRVESKLTPCLSSQALYHGKRILSGSQEDILL